MMTAGPLGKSRQDRPCATDFVIASRQCEIDDLSHLMRMGQLVAVISNLIHALQRERGASNVHLGSGGERFAAQLDDLRAASDELAQTFYGALNEVASRTIGVQSGARLFSRIAHAVHVLEGLAPLRARIRALDLAPDEAVRHYSAMVGSLLAVVFEAADAAMDPTISRLLVAMFNFMQGKELAGQERALGAAGFAQGEFDAAHAERLSDLIEGQERCFDIFAEFADADSQALWCAALGATDQAEVERLRRLACTGNLSALIRSESASAHISDHWFLLMTARIDAMKEVEDHLEDQLQALCVERLEQARLRLAEHESRIGALQQTDVAEPDALDKDAVEENGSFVVFCGPERYSSESLSPRLGRAIIEMVHDQSQRLQSMQDELDAAREALEERKVVERAKALLMKHRKLQEDDAHRLLRKMAMNQGKRLVDVARAVVSMADVLG
ncbi:nitrate- and nitrite sensing domain-containing protein [Alcanivorax sp. JB21]|nr:nitrate- and nitrite sensing domain-containing protein [Alcanivorax limicola]